MDSVRKRRAVRAELEGESPTLIDYNSIRSSKPPIGGGTVNVELGIIHWIFIFVVIGGTVAAVFRLDTKFPDPVPAEVQDQFSEVRARRWLTELTSHGPRPSGSHQLEVIARRMILDELKDIQRTARREHHEIQITEQRPSGCFDLGFLAQFTLCYREVLNILVRIGPAGRSPTKHSLLLSCHFDSVPASPGATDDGVSCAIMLDSLRVRSYGYRELNAWLPFEICAFLNLKTYILQVISQQANPLEHDIIMLFNGAEENFLQAAHGFISSHPWRHSIRAFINLEGCGAGGREILFQAGPGNPWLLKSYMESAPHPHCSVIAQEIFQTGAIPSDTDFRIYRDHGRVPGLDIAYTRNGYVYHTEFDRPEFIHTGAIQRAGENLLAIVRNLLESPYFVNPATYHEGNWVFFDVVGLFSIFYSMKFGTVLNLSTVAAVLIKILLNLFDEKSYSVLQFGISLFVHVSVSAVIVTAAVLGMTWVVTMLNLTLVWYSRHWLVLPLYYVPATVFGFKIHLLIARKMSHHKNSLILESCFHDSTMLLFSLILFIMTYKGMASAFMVTIFTLFPLLRSPIFSGMKSVFGKSHGNWTFVVGAAASLFPVIFMGSYGLIICFEFFIPMMGRLGTSVNPERIIAFLSVLAALGTNLLMGSWLYVSRKMDRLLNASLAVCAALILLLLFTPLGHPYEWDAEHPRLRRVNLMHVHRKMYDRSGALERDDTGLWLSSFDYRMTDDMHQSLINGAVTPNCSQARDDFCDLPYYVPVQTMKTKWLELKERPSFPKQIDIKLLEVKHSVTGGEKDRFRMKFSLTGPDHMTVFMAAEPGYKLLRWSFTDRDLLNSSMKPNETFFLFLAYAQTGNNETVPWEFTLEMTTDDDIEVRRQQNRSSHHSQTRLLIGVASHIIHGKHMKSPTITDIEKLIRHRRQEPTGSSSDSESSRDWWKWRMTPSSWTSEYVSKYF